MEGYLKVTPEQLKKTAQEFLAAGERINSLTSEMMSIITSLKSVWQGAAADSYLNRFMGLEDDMARINAMISEHVSDLNEMAATYQAAEDANIEASAALNDDVMV